MGLTSSFIILILKVSQLKLVTDYRPITIINSVTKLFTKILAERLNIVSGGLVFDNQFGFMKGKQTTDNIVLVNEVCHNLIMGKAEELILKIEKNALIRSTRRFQMLS